MDKFNTLDGIVAPLDRANVDTDAIIPKQFLKAIGKTGFGPNLFDEWRYADRGEPGMDNGKRPLKEDFVLNKDRYREAQILVARQNFGCGSSREHAPWALLDYGFKVVIAPSFADIFFNNCFKNGLLAIKLPEDVVDRILRDCTVTPGYRLTIDLQAQTVRLPSGDPVKFDIDGFRRDCLLNGLDEIGLTLRHADKIRAFETRRREAQPWLFG
jgi:3-isopropylmalate/(R)-2-methylmalate dehydratase small subunit